MTNYDAMQSMLQKLEWMSNQGMDKTDEFLELRAKAALHYNTLTTYEKAQFQQSNMGGTYSEYLLTPMSRWFHLDTKSYYTAMGIGRCSTNGPEENKTRYAIYWSDTKKEYKVRELAEFLDGRFIPLGADGEPIPVYNDGSGILLEVPITRSSAGNTPPVSPPERPLACHFDPPVNIGSLETKPPGESFYG
jgi:hypothetical protein